MPVQTANKGTKKGSRFSEGLLYFVDMLKKPELQQQELAATPSSPTRM